MLNELNLGKGKNRKRNDHIQESNIIVSIPVFDQCVSEFRMKEKQTPKIKRKRMKELVGVGQSGGAVAPPVGAAPSGGSSQGRGRGPTSAKPAGVPGKQASGWKHNPFSTLAAVTAQSAKAAKKQPPPDDDDPDYVYEDDRKHSRKNPNLEEYQKGAEKAP